MEYAFLGRSGCGASEIIKNLAEKSTETCKLVKIFMNHEQIFALKD